LNILNNPNMRYKRILLVFVIVSGLLSVIYGLVKLSIIGCDFQIENANILLNKKSPYDLYIKSPYLFKFKRIPTILPQGLYILIPFTFLGDSFGAILYGIIGILGLFLCSFLKKENKNFHIIFFLLLCTDPYRSNLSLGQPLFFYFPLFILFDYFMKHKDSWIFNIFINPLILMLLFVKPSLSYWIPFYYGFKLRNILIYFISLLFQFIIILIFSIQTKTSIFNFFRSYALITREHMRLSHEPVSIFSINFSSFFSSINSLFVILILFLIFSIIIIKIKKIKEIKDFQFMFIIILLSFTFFYHANADIFLLILPLFVLNDNVFQKKYIPFIIFLIYLILEKIIILLNKGISQKIILNNFTLIVILYMCIQIIWDQS